ncbi:hypothetical protein CLCR_01324 [Cladophialophora carrionii]|uniref:Uncharacterized protein n=1 Tax=Cladophialophora carrionii TaxID=86049 RepID=A0A1C1CCE3_9EURO|nr:hypothetical protein CLCR_01324 [Cladophialophora carrionii]
MSPGDSMSESVIAPVWSGEAFLACLLACSVPRKGARATPFNNNIGVLLYLYRPYPTTNSTAPPPTVARELKSATRVTRTRRRGTHTPIPPVPLCRGTDTPGPPSADPLGHIELELTDPAEEAPKRTSEVRAHVLLEQADGKGIKGFNVLIKGLAWEVGVPLEDVDDDGPPGDDVALLRFFVKEDEGADDVGAETICATG